MPMLWRCQPEKARWITPHGIRPKADTLEPCGNAGLEKVSIIALAVHTRRLGKDVEHRHRRIECAVGILEHVSDIPRQLGLRRTVATGDIAHGAAAARASKAFAGGRRMGADGAAPECGLAPPRFADDDHRHAGLDVERDAVDRL